MAAGGCVSGEELPRRARACADRGERLWAAGDRRRADQSSGHVPDHGRAATCCDCDQQLHDRRDRGDERAGLLRTRRPAHGYCRAAGGGRVQRLAHRGASCAETEDPGHRLCPDRADGVSLRADGVQDSDRRLPMIAPNKRDIIVAAVLRWGAYGSFAIVCVGLLLGLHDAPMGRELVRVGLLVLIATPVSRIVTLLITFLIDKDKKYALISFTVLLIVVLSSVYGIASH